MDGHTGHPCTTQRQRNQKARASFLEFIWEQKLTSEKYVVKSLGNKLSDVCRCAVNNNFNSRILHPAASRLVVVCGIFMIVLLKQEKSVPVEVKSLSLV